MHPIPTDSLTFLFTDIENSTQLWEQHPEAMKIALARHHTILRQTIADHHGQVFKAVGDGFHAAFPSAIDGAQASMAAQRALYAEAWAKETPIKVRMALHTGIAEAHNGDYSGPLFNLLARLIAAAHGGQTLLSAALYEQVQAHLPPDVEVRDMGERRLRSITRPQRIYQILAAGLPAQFPPLKTLDDFHTNLPAQLTSFIGREKEMDDVKDLIKTNRLITLIGSGGTGKTRLSLQVAADLLDSFPDDVWFVEFAPLSDPARVQQTVIATVGLREGMEQASPTLLNDYLREKKTLLIFDNCEHLLDASSRLAYTLLQSCPKLHIIASSREILGIPGERTYRVPSLSIPEKDHQPPLEVLTHYEAVRLFVDRAQTVQSSFALTEINAVAVANICSQLDGIPLAIELAAARIRMLTVEQIREGLNDRFRLLTNGNRTTLPRQQTLRALIDWSYDLLPELEKTLLRRLSVFAGGWTLEAAEEVCKDEVGRMNDEENLSSALFHPSGFILHPFDVLDLLTQLVNKSLVVADSDNTSEPRYHLLETVRQYAHEKLTVDESTQSHANHLKYFLWLAESAEPELTGPHAATWLRRLEGELDNIRAALEWSRKNDAQAGLRLASALLWFWQEYGYIGDGYQWLKELLAEQEGQLPSIVHARALSIMAQFLIWGLREPDDSYQIIEKSLSISQRLGDKQAIAMGLRLKALILSGTHGKRIYGRQLTFESLAIYRELDDQSGIAWALTYLGGCLGNISSAVAPIYLKEALAIFRKMQYQAGIVHVLLHLGELSFEQLNYRAAQLWLEEALEIQRQLGSGGNTMRILLLLCHIAVIEEDHAKVEKLMREYLSNFKNVKSISTWVWANTAYFHLRIGNIAEAILLFQKNLQAFKEAGDKLGLTYTVECVASLMVQQKQHYDRALQLFAWADAMRNALAFKRFSIEKTDLDRDLLLIRAQIDEAAFLTAQTTGQGMSLEQVIALASQTMDSRL